MRKEAVPKYLITLFVACSTVVSAAGIFSMNKKLAIAILIIATIIAIKLAYDQLRSNKNAALAALQKSLPPPSAIEVRKLNNESEVKMIAELDRRIYGEHSINFKGLLAWWKRYPGGVSVLIKNAKIIGAVGIWPLSRKRFIELANGQVDETDIEKLNIVKKKDNKSQVYWYLGDIVLEASFRKKKLTLVLLEEAVRCWLNEGNLADKIDLCALGFTKEGCSILERFGFNTVIKSPSGYPVYRRTATIRELRKDYEDKIAAPLRGIKANWLDKLQPVVMGSASAKQEGH
jgi:hypothetical protein